MDRGIPGDEVHAETRKADPPVFYLVGTPKAGFRALELVDALRDRLGDIAKLCLRGSASTSR